MDGSVTLDGRVENGTRFLSRCVHQIYDKGYLHDIIAESYRLLMAQYQKNYPEEFPTRKGEIEREYVKALEILPFFRDSKQEPREIPAYDSTTFLLEWANSINRAYTVLTDGKNGDVIDILYDPRTVFAHTSILMRDFKDKLPYLSRTLQALDTSAKRFLVNNLPELREEKKAQRIQEWHKSLPKDLAEIVYEGDLADIAYLGSKAMADAFATYFSHHCLSGSLGKTFFGSGNFFVPSYELEQIDVHHLYSYVRISQRVLSKYILKKAREQGLTTKDKELWEGILAELNETHRISKESETRKAVRPLLDLLHNELVSYVKSLYSTDTSVLRPDIIPFVSQLDPLHMLRSEKPNDTKDGAIFADEIGTGKTLSAILADALYRKEGQVRKTLVICRNQMKGEWKERFSKYLSEETLQKYYGFGENGNRIRVVFGSHSMRDIDENTVVIANYEMVNRSLKYIKDEEKTLIELAEQGFANGLDEISEDDDIFKKIAAEFDNARNQYNGMQLEDIKREFSHRPKCLEWIGDDKVKALYLKTAETVLKDEKHTVESLFSYQADYLILDEAHAIKNPSRARAQGVELLAENIPRIALLTGTLIPNRYEDITVPLRIVRAEYKPETMDMNESFSVLGPKIRRIRQALIPYLSRSIREDVLPRNYFITPDEDRVEIVESDELTHVTYRAIIESPWMSHTKKMRLTRLATLNPAIAINKLFEMSRKDTAATHILEDIIDNLSIETLELVESGRYVPPKYRRIAEKTKNYDGNTVIFTSHIEGNTRPMSQQIVPSTTLVDFLSGNTERVVLLHDGKTPDHAEEEKSERAYVLRRFIGGTNIDLAASYETLGESKDLTSARMAISTDLHFVLPDQPIGRVDRITQYHDVEVAYLTVADKRLSAGTKSGLTIDEAVLQLGRDKKLVSSIIIDGKPPGEEEMEAYRRIMAQSGEAPQTYTPLKDGLDVDVDSLDDSKRLTIFIRKTRDDKKGSEEKVRDFDERLRIAYIQDLVLDPTSFTYKSNQMVAQLIVPLLGGSFADVGGGPASLAIAGGIETNYDNIDAIDWKKSLEAVLSERGMQFPHNVRFYHAFLSDFAKNSQAQYSFVTCNNMFHWTNLQEREKVFRDINVLLPEGGKFILGLPGVYSGLAKDNLELLLLNAGFEPDFIGQVLTFQDSSFNQLVAISTKAGLPEITPLKPNDLKLNVKLTYGRTSRRLQHRIISNRRTKRNRAESFNIEGIDVREILA